MTRVDDRTRASPSRARARPRARPDGRAKGLLCTSCYALSAHPRRARADPRASSFSKPRLHRAASPALSPRPRPRPSSASSSSSRPRMPTPRCAPPQLRTKRRTEKPRLPALSNRLRPRDRAIARATRGAERNARATREKNTSRVLVPTPVRRARPRPPPASATAGAATRRFGCAPREKTAETPFPSRPRASGVFARATWRSRGRYLVIFRVSEPVSKKVFSRVFGKKFFH